MNEYACSAPERQVLQIDGRQIGVVAWGGSGRDVLLLHGITSNAYTWWRVAPSLVQAGYRVFSLDMPGHGISDVADDHRISGIAAIVGQVIAALDLHDLILIGHSWGGATTLELASGDNPARAMLHAAVAIDPALGMTPERGAEWVGGFLAGVGEPFEVNEANLKINKPDWKPCDRYWKCRAYLECRSAAVHGLFTGSGAWDLTPRTADIDVPLLVLVADPAQTVIPPEYRAQLRAIIEPKGNTVIEVAGTSHDMFRGDGFEPTMAQLAPWLGNLPR